MGTLRFGRHETITCIVDVEAKGSGGEPACLAFKTTTYWVGGGVWLSDDGYVLKPRGVGDSYYVLPKGAEAGQITGLPHPFPAYSVPFIEYFGGFSLWWGIGVIVLWAVGVKKVRQHKQRAFAAKQASSPIDRGPPRLDTEGDRFVYDTIKEKLTQGEVVQHQAYASSWDYENEKEGDDVFFLALTSKRLFIVTTRKGAFGILYENNGIDEIDRSAVAEAFVEHGKVLFVTTVDGVQRGYIIKGTSALSNQHAFLMNAGRLLSEGHAA